MNWYILSYYHYHILRWYYSLFVKAISQTFPTQSAMIISSNPGVSWHVTHAPIPRLPPRIPETPKPRVPGFLDPPLPSQDAPQLCPFLTTDVDTLHAKLFHFATISKVKRNLWPT